MSHLTEYQIPFQDDQPLTPVHSISPNIQSSNYSGSKGRFSEPLFNPEKKSPKRVSISPDSITFEIPSKPSDVSFPTKDLSMFDRKLTKAESDDLFERLDKEIEKKKTRIGGGKSVGIKKNSHKSVQVQGDVVSRLLRYGENVKKKNEERIRIKQEREDEEICRLKEKVRKSDVSFRRSPPGEISLFTSSKDVSVSSSNISSAKHSTRPLSLNSPLKVIEKIQKLVKIPAFRVK